MWICVVAVWQVKCPQCKRPLYQTEWHIQTRLWTLSVKKDPSFPAPSVRVGLWSWSAVFKKMLYSRSGPYCIWFGFISVFILDKWKSLQSFFFFFKMFRNKGSVQWMFCFMWESLLVFDIDLRYLLKPDCYWLIMSYATFPLSRTGRVGFISAQI